MKLSKQCEFCEARARSVFNVLDEEQAKDVTRNKSCGVYKKGQYVFSENNMPLGLFCINDGKIKLTTKGVDGKEQILRLLKSGDVLGYRALISNERYHCSAIALENSSICFIPKEYIVNLMQQNHTLTFEMVRKISTDLKVAEEHIVSLSQRNVRERMAEALLFLKSTYGVEADGETLNITLTREEIADYVGTSTESCIRLLSEFNQDKIVELAGKKIRLLDLPKLIKTANLND